MIRLFRVFFPKSVLGLVVSEAVLIFASFAASAYLTVDSLEIFMLYDRGFTTLLIGTASIMLGLYAQNLYTEFRIRSRIVLLQQVVMTLGLVFMTQALLGYISVEWMIPRWTALIAAAILVFVLPIWRVAYTTIIYKSLGADRVLFLGTSHLSTIIAGRLMEAPELGLEVVGFLEEGVPPESDEVRKRIVGSIDDLAKIAAQVRPSQIIVGLTEQRRKLPTAALLDLRFSGVRIQDAATLYETAFGRVPIMSLRPSQLIFSTELGPRPWSLRLQSFYSFIGGLIGLVLAGPLMLAVALAVRFTSRGPVIYRQERVGLDGRPFTVFKFRSMVVDAEARTGAVWASKHDARVTPIGRYLRRMRLDELPQLFNLVRGEMAIVGPRPERPEFVVTLSEQIPFYRQRHSVKPGLTGWAQINYKYGETIEDTVVKLEYDLYYIKNLSPSLDAYIVFHTIKVMLLSQSGQ